MSIWGKIIGGGAGFALGGPLGALIGLAAGHVVDKTADAAAATRQPDTDDRKAAFSIALIALSAKMAKADGVVTRDEILAFREKTHIAPADIPAVAKIWNMARETPEGFEGYARQVARLFPPGSAVLEELMALLFTIALADGKITEGEQFYLREVARILGFDETGYDRLAATHGDEASSPYRVLGVDAGCSDADLRKAWVALAARHHPDKLVAEGMPEEFIAAANDRLAQINAAYEKIKGMRRAANPRASI